MNPSTFNAMLIRMLVNGQFMALEHTLLSYFPKLFCVSAMEFVITLIESTLKHLATVRSSVFMLQYSSYLHYCARITNKICTFVLLANKQNFRVN